MSKLEWDDEAVRQYETGISHVAIYPYDSSVEEPEEGYVAGYAWSGITGITESPSGAEATAVYADNIKYLNLMSEEELGLTVEAINYPEAFEKCDGTASLVAGVKIGQQSRIPFGMGYKTKKCDSNGNDIGEILHLVWNALAAPSEKAYSTVNDSPENMTFSWTLTTTKVKFSDDTLGLKPISHLEIDSSIVNADFWAALDALLFGSTSTSAMFPKDPSEIFALYDETVTEAV